MGERSLSRKRGNRQALERNLVTGLILRGRILTTEIKAKHVKPMAEKLLNNAKADTLASRRQAASFLTTKAAVDQLFKVIVPALKPVSGGHLRLIKTMPRKGDGAAQAWLVINQVAAKPAKPSQEAKVAKSKKPATLKKETKSE